MLLVKKTNKRFSIWIAAHSIRLPLADIGVSQLHNRVLTCPIYFCTLHRPFVSHLSRCASVWAQLMMGSPISWTIYVPMYQLAAVWHVGGLWLSKLHLRHLFLHIRIIIKVISVLLADRKENKKPFYTVDSLLPGQWSTFSIVICEYRSSDSPYFIDTAWPSVMDERWTPEGLLINETHINDNRTPASHHKDEGQETLVWTSSSQHWLTLCFTGTSSFITLSLKKTMNWFVDTSCRYCIDLYCNSTFSNRCAFSTLWGTGIAKTNPCQHFDRNAKSNTIGDQKNSDLPL